MSGRPVDQWPTYSTWPLSSCLPCKGEPPQGDATLVVASSHQSIVQ